MAYRWTEADVDKVQRRNGVTTWQVPASPPHTLPVTAEPREVNARLKAAMRGKAPKNPSKYRNRKVRDAEGNVHDSEKEYRRWCDLQLRERAGEISELRRQRVFDLVVIGIDGKPALICRYECDASYIENGALVCEDTKSEPTRKKRDYVIKRKLMAALHGIHIRET